MHLMKVKDIVKLFVGNGLCMNSKTPIVWRGLTAYNLYK